MTLENILFTFFAGDSEPNISSVDLPGTIAKVRSEIKKIQRKAEEYDAEISRLINSSDFRDKNQLIANLQQLNDLRRQENIKLQQSNEQEIIMLQQLNEQEKIKFQQEMQQQHKEFLQGLIRKGVFDLIRFLYLDLRHNTIAHDGSISQGIWEMSHFR
jgi:ribosome-binding ATPase YchF (GTP1/OBG family)